MTAVTPLRQPALYNLVLGARSGHGLKHGAVVVLTWLTHVTIRFLDWLAERMLSPDVTSGHQRTGRRGEEDAYFYLRHLGYIMVARNFRSPRRRGEIDLIGWDNDVLCFIEVKTRTTRDVKPAQTAVDGDKQRALAAVARHYLARLPTIPQWRFDVVTVYYDQRPSQPQFEVFKNLTCRKIDYLRLPRKGFA